MTKHLKTIRSALVITVIFAQGFIFSLTPAAVVAQTDDKSQTNTQTSTDSAANKKESATGSAEGGNTNQQQSQPGPTKPNGADKVEYEYNKETKKWENDKYIWDPATNKTTPKQEQKYSYNPETGHWDTTEWVYHPESGEYEANKKSTATNPNGSTQATSPQTSAQSSANPTTQSTIGDQSGSSIDTTGPDSNNQINSSNNNSGTFNNWHNAQISNNITQNTKSGDASVIQNTTGGSATSGEATSQANVINMLQSSWGLSDAELTTFTANLAGDVYGDLVVNTGPDSNNQINSSNDTELTVNNITNNRIINNIDANSVSGNATVSGNTEGGDATTGNASAMVNVVNMINSMILSGESFYGTINIDGNLDGDVLLPQAALDSLIASSGPNSNNQIDSDNDTDLDVNVNNDTTIANNVNSSAQSGGASVSGNTIGGNATSGNASNDTTIINLVGNDVTAENSLLVFVNVAGEWVGMITHAPGSNAALLGTGVNSNNQINRSNDTDLTLNSDTTNQIENNINVNAQSGDAEVSKNTIGGDATTGNASTDVNIFNMANSTLSAENWFGILHLNILGNWNGSFGIDTAFGDNPQPTATNDANTSKPTTQSSHSRPTLSFRPQAPTQPTQTNFTATVQQDSTTSQSGEQQTSAEDETKTEDNDNGQVANANDSNDNQDDEDSSLNPLPFIGGAVALSLIGGERAYSRRNKS